MTLQAAEMRCSRGVGSPLWSNHLCLVWALTLPVAIYSGGGYMEWVVGSVNQFCFLLPNGITYCYL